MESCVNKFYKDAYSSDPLSALNAPMPPQFLSESPFAIPPRSPKAQEYAERAGRHRQVQRIDIAPFTLKAESRNCCRKTATFRGFMRVEVAAKRNREEVSAKQGRSGEIAPVLREMS